jgi:hypothetical protein
MRQRPEEKLLPATTMPATTAVSEARVRASDTVSSMRFFFQVFDCSLLRLKYAPSPDWSQIRLGSMMSVIALIPTVRSQRKMMSYSVESYEVLTL